MSKITKTVEEIKDPLSGLRLEVHTEISNGKMKQWFVPLFKMATDDSGLHIATFPKRSRQ